MLLSEQLRSVMIHRSRIMGTALFLFMQSRRYDSLFYSIQFTNLVASFCVGLR